MCQQSSGAHPVDKLINSGRSNSNATVVSESALNQARISTTHAKQSGTMSVNFTFSTTKSILCELGSSARIGKLFKRMGCKQKQTLLVVTDQGIMNAKLAENCIHGLSQEGFNVKVYSNVVADPPEVKILEALEVSKQQNAVGVIGFGGGSSMDVAKIVAFLSHQDCQQELGEIYGIDQCVGHRLPLVQVPTTAGRKGVVWCVQLILICFIILSEY